jgi:hypothetical protein
VAFIEGANALPDFGGGVKAGGVVEGTATTALLWVPRSLAAGNGLAYKYVPGAGLYLDNGTAADRARAADTAGGNLGAGVGASAPHHWTAAGVLTPQLTGRAFYLAGSNGDYAAAVAPVEQSTPAGNTFAARHGNLEGTLLASAARTASTASADQTNPNGVGVLVWLNVTVQPGTAETLTVQVQAKEPVAGGYHAILVGTPIVGNAGAGLWPPFMLHPTAKDAAGRVTSKNDVPLPRTWRVSVVHSGASSWTYSVGYSLVVG